MAIEARHLNSIFMPQLIQNRDLVNPTLQGNGGSAYNVQQLRFSGIPSPAALPENQFFYQSPVCDSVQAKTSVNTDSGVTYNIPAPRKRSRDVYNQLSFEAAPPQKSSGLSNLAGKTFLPDVSQYQFEIDDIISQHTKKIRMELEERQKQQARLLSAAIGEGVMKKLKEKDEQIQRIAKFNPVLQERAKSLYVENQLLRDIAQSHEATANSLRKNLEQLLQHVSADERVSAAAVAGTLYDDAESCCGSSNGVGDANDEGCSNISGDRRCRICRERESSVLLLPCRHLCLCNGCGSGSHHLQSCPICSSAVTATLHVNLS